MGRKTRKQLEAKKKDKSINPGLLRLWAQIVNELDAAYALLLEDESEIVQKLKTQYKEYLSHDEFGLAHYALVQLGKKQEQLPEFHQSLENAEKLMLDQEDYSS